jgi:hypothetical protein
MGLVVDQNHLFDLAAKHREKITGQPVTAAKIHNSRMIEPLVDTGIDLKALQNLFEFQMPPWATACKTLRIRPLWPSSDAANESNRPFQPDRRS